MAITIQFVNRNTQAEGIRVYKSATVFTKDTLPDVHSTLSGDAVEFIDPDVVRDDTFFYMFETFKGEDSNFSDLVHTIALVSETGPGPQVLLPGSDNWTGFFGEIPAQDFITGTALANHFGLADGTDQHDDAPWLKFVYDGKVLFVAQKPLRHTISWDSIHAKNLVYGDRVIEVQGDLYSVRLLRGADVDPSPAVTGYDPVGTENSEWNRLLYAVHNGVHTTSDNPTPPGAWPLYSDRDLVVHSTGGNGSRNWCQETRASNATQSVYRGSSGVSGFYFTGASSATANYGWRPVLELLKHGDIFLGEVPASELIDGETLAATIGLTAGTAQFPDEPWLHYKTRTGKTLYVAKKPLRHSATWDQINARGAVFGTSVVVIGGKRFKVRLLKGADVDPTPVASVSYDPVGTSDSEWNRLIYNVHNGIHADSNNQTPPGTWPLYSDTDLVVNTGGNGRRSWCQETNASDATRRVTRGRNGVSYFTFQSSSTTASLYGWRPVLELIED